MQLSEGFEGIDEQVTDNKLFGMLQEFMVGKSLPEHLRNQLVQAISGEPAPAPVGTLQAGAVKLDLTAPPGGSVHPTAPLDQEELAKRQR